MNGEFYYRRLLCAVINTGSTRGRFRMVARSAVGFAVLGGDQRTGGVLEEEDGEAGVPRVPNQLVGLPHVVRDPSPRGVLVVQDPLRAQGIPRIAAELVGAVEDSGALQPVEVIVVPGHDPELSDPVHSRLEHLASLPVSTEQIFADGQRGDGPGGHGMRSARLLLEAGIAPAFGGVFALFLLVEILAF